MDVLGFKSVGKHNASNQTLRFFYKLVRYVTPIYPQKPLTKLCNVKENMTTLDTGSNALMVNMVRA